MAALQRIAVLLALGGLLLAASSRSQSNATEPQPAGSAATALAGTADPVAAARPRPLAVGDYFAIRDVGQAEISPDGRFVAYTVTTTDLEENERETALWVVASGGGEPVRWSAPGYSVSQPQWSPDGRYLTVLASRESGLPDAKGSGETQVWAFRRDGGDAQPLTDVEQGVGSYLWAPDSTRLLLSVQDPKPKVDGESEEEEEEDEPQPWVIDRLQFKEDYTGYLDRRRTHLYVFHLADASLVQITSGDFDDGAPAWSPDGKLVAFSSNRSDEPDGNENTDIWIVSAEATDQGKTLRQLTTNPGSDGSPAFSPDGSEIVFVTTREPEIIWYDVSQLATVPVAGGEPSLVGADLDRNVGSPRFSPDGSRIRFLYEDGGESQLASLARRDRTGKSLRRLVAGGTAVAGFSQAETGALALRDSRPQLPDEVFFLAGEADAPRQLTRTNGDLLAGLELGEVREVELTSRDGTPIEAFLTLPPGYDARLTYPTLLWIHGGPVSQYDYGFDFTSQLFAAHGYVVLRPNPRGSSGYGQQFSLAIWQSWGQKDYEDVMAAVDYAIAEGLSDPKRLGVGGWSYGGILTNYVITQTGRFAGAMTGASEVLYVSNYGHDHYQLAWEKELGLPWENRELWERISPFNSVEKITTPTLIMGGEEDWNVPILNSEQLYQALRRLGRTTQLVVYPGEHHGIRRPAFQKDRFERWLEWFDRYVKGS